MCFKSSRMFKAGLRNFLHVLESFFRILATADYLINWKAQSPFPDHEHKGFVSHHLIFAFVYLQYLCHSYTGGSM